jgi:Asp/Glu/hydantoin racemase
MLTKSLGLVHTVPKLCDVFAELASELLPGTKTTVVVDELLLRDTIQRGEVATETRTRLASHVEWLAGSGVDAVLVTCSSIGAVTDGLNERAPVPVVRVDRAMAQAAVRAGRRVGVIATLEATLVPTAQLVAREAAAAGADVEVLTAVCAGAFEALQAGDVDCHDEIVRRELGSLLDEVDVVVLAQASTARILAQLATVPRVPVLSSPRLAVEQLAAADGASER